MNMYKKGLWTSDLEFCLVRVRRLPSDLLDSKWLEIEDQGY